MVCFVVSSFVTQYRAAAVAAVAAVTAPTATDKVFLETTPFPDVINAISCARPLLTTTRPSYTAMPLSVAQSPTPKHFRLRSGQ